MRSLNSANGYSLYFCAVNNANDNMMTDIIEPKSSMLMPEGYDSWRKAIEVKIETAKLHAALHVNSDMLSLYWSIGKDILSKQEEQGWGKQVIAQLSRDLSVRFSDDRGYSERNLGYMKQFAKEYPDYPILQVPLAKIQKSPILQVALAKLPKDNESVQVPLTQISWYHHISLIPKVKEIEN